MPRSRKNGRNPGRTPTTAIESRKRAHCNLDDTAEPTAGTSHGEVVGVDGTAATSGNKKHFSTPKINLSSALFSDIKETDHFVDKTNMIEVLFNDSPYVLITRPRRFGKSTIMNMVKEFVEKKVDKAGKEIQRSPENDRAFPKMNLLLFEDKNLEISKWDKFSNHRGKYPIIYVDFQSVGGDDRLDILYSFGTTISKAFKFHSYLLHYEGLWLTKKEKNKFEEYLDPTPTVSSSEGNRRGLESFLLHYIQNSLTFLAEILHRRFEHKIYLFIDEYDAPVNNTIFKNKDLCVKINEILHYLFINLLKREDSYIARALITGISFIGSIGLSGLNNVRKHMFLRGAQGDDRYETFYGITEEELKKLTTKFKERFWQGDDILPLEQVKSYYNGYKSIGTSGVKIYSIWSIVNALENGKLSNYWEKSGIMESARQGLKLPIVRIAINHLLEDRCIECEIPDNLELKHLLDLSDVILKWEEKRTLLKPDVVLSFLMQQGYLMYVDQIDVNTIDENIFKVKIPNQLIKTQFKLLTKDYFEPDYDKLIANITAVFDDFPDKLTDAIVERLITCMQEAFEYVSKKWLQSNEDAYHSVIFQCLCNSSKYKSCTELPGKKARLDIAFTVGNRAIIIEVKHRKTALEAFEQIISRKYAEILKNSLSNKELKCVCMGLNVDENNKVSIAYNNTDNPDSPRVIFLENGD